MDEVAVAERLATLTAAIANVERMLVEMRDSVMRTQSEANVRLDAQEARLTALRLEFAQHCGESDVDEARRQTQAERDRHVVGQIAGHEVRIVALEKLAPAMKLVIWIGGIVGASVVALIWALITGQAVLAFP